MIVFPNCKINLGLKVKEKRTDGYHEIESLILPTKLCDALEIIESPKVSFTFSGISIDGDFKDNLIYKAYLLLKEKYSIPAIAVHLHKAIPAQAGLGGGSADASFMLKLLNDYFELNLSYEDLKTLSLQLGSDCPFFIKNTPSFISGRGDILEETKLDLNGYYIAIVKPNVHINTGEAYNNIIRSKSSFDIKTIINAPLSSWKELVFNDFENYAFSKHFVIRSLKNKLYDNGAIYASMSGSGSAVYGIFEESPGLKSEFRDHFYWEGKQ